MSVQNEKGRARVITGPPPQDGSAVFLLPALSPEDMRWHRACMGWVALAVGLVALVLFAVVEQGGSRLSFLEPRQGETAGALRHAGDAHKLPAIYPLLFVGIALVFSGGYYLYMSMEDNHEAAMNELRFHQSRRDDAVVGAHGVVVVLVLVLLAGAIDVVEIILIAVVVVMMYSYFYIANFSNSMYHKRQDDLEYGVPNPRDEFRYTQGYHAGMCVHVFLWVWIATRVGISATAADYNDAPAFTAGAIVIICLNATLPYAYWCHITRSSPLRFKRNVLSYIERIHHASLVLLGIVLLPGIAPY